jgi:hypothetical protein
MKKLLLLAIITLSIVTSYAKDKGPKITVEDDTVFIDKKAIFILSEIKKAKFETKDYFLKDLSGKKIALLQSDCYEDPTSLNPYYGKSPSAPKYNNSCYTKITFLESKNTADFNYYHKKVKLAEFLVECGLVKNGAIAQEDEEEFILIHGNKNVEEKNQKLGGNTIIINNNTTPSTGNGVNFNINR